MGLFGNRKNEEEEEPTSAAPSAPATARSESGTPSPGRSEGSVRSHQTKVGPGSTQKGESVAHIGKSIVFKGELTGDEDLEIDGQVEGNIQLPSHTLTIGAHGKVKAEILAKCVQVVGRVAGNIQATERVEVQASGIVEGDIRAPRLLVQEGAVVNGAIDMSKREGAAATPRPGAKPDVHATPEPARKTG